MKQILSLNIAIISAEETMILRHPSTIYTNDNIPVELCTDEADLNYKIARLTTAIPLPPIGVWVEKDRVYAYGDKLVKCVQSHWRMNFAPKDTPALFLIIEKVASTEYPVFVHPTGAHDAYRLKDRVTYKDKIWECVSDYCVYAPDVFGWIEVKL